MTLEHRVLVVEQELQILKSQIQVTLLTIQEHLLNNTYPALRTKDTRVSAQPAAEAQTSLAQSASLKKISITETPPEVEVTMEENSFFPAPQLKQVHSAGLTSNEPRNAEQYPQSAPPARPANNEPRYAEPYRLPTPPARFANDEPYEQSARPASNAPRYADRNEQFSAPELPSYNEVRYAGERNQNQVQEERNQAADVRLWIELDKWVDQKVKEVGIQRTRELISLFEGPEHELLMQVVEIYEKRPEVVRPRSVPRPRPVATIAPQTHVVAEEWQKFANTSKVRNATYRPFGEHQELALRLIADILGASQAEPNNAQSNSSSNH